jgi:hypothetical protein
MGHRGNANVGEALWYAVPYGRGRVKGRSKRNAGSPCILFLHHRLLHECADRATLNPCLQPSILPRHRNHRFVEYRVLDGEKSRRYFEWLE